MERTRFTSGAVMYSEILGMLLVWTLSRKTRKDKIPS